MRRSVGYCEPNFAYAGQMGTWKFVYTPATSLPKGTKLKFDLLTKSRPIDWQLPQTNVKKTENLIWGQLPNGKAFVAKQEKGFSPAEYEFTLPLEVKAGETFMICIGTPGEDVEKKGNLSQKQTQRRKAFHLYIDPKGKGQYQDPEVFHMDVRGNELENIRIITPSLVWRNKRFDVIVRFEDKFGNLTANAPENTLVDLSYDHLRESLNWKLFVPETGFINLPNLYFNEPGVYKIRLLNQTTKQVYHSPPIKCFAEEELNLFWGVLHGESEKVDSIENIETCLRHFRDDKALQFYASSHFENEETVSSDNWKTITSQLNEFTEEDRFAGFIGFQYVGDPKEEGIRLFITPKDNKQILKKKDSKSNSLKKIYKTYNSKEWMAIPTMTMGKGSSYDFKNFNPEFEKVVEIYNAWGSSECLEKEGNPKPIKGKGKKALVEAQEGSIINALKENCRFGFVAGGLDDRGIYSELYDIEQNQYFPGLTAILAKNHTRSSLFDALSKKSCYATTGARMIIGFNIAGKPIGSELNTKDKPGLEFNRHVSGFVVGTDTIEAIEIVRNGSVIHTIHPENYKTEFTYDDMDQLSKVALKSPDDKPRFAFYYLRIKQSDGHIGWSSPIWVDQIAATKKGKKA
ncbi:MAG: DUF3604 domain-containing protein [Chlamydiota bacterium]|jgi:hypothetical protein